MIAHAGHEWRTLSDKMYYRGNQIIGVYHKGRKIYPENAAYLTFSSSASFTLRTYNRSKNWNGTIEYSFDRRNWNAWDGTEIHSEKKLYLRGFGNTKITGNDDTARWLIDGNRVECEGDIKNILEYRYSYYPEMASHCFYMLFYGCTSLIKAPELSATKLSWYCYSHMFEGCTELEEVQQVLPAATAAVGCYQYMFRECAKLKRSPSLPAATLYEHCYEGMFWGCKSLSYAPSLPALTLASACYMDMFIGCDNLTSTPYLPARTLAPSCYNEMFRSCANLSRVTYLPATTLDRYCYAYMFYTCPSLKISDTFGTDTSGDRYIYSYRIPRSGTGTDAYNAMLHMFGGTGGTFAGTPTVNTTYYCTRSPVAA